MTVGNAVTFVHSEKRSSHDYPIHAAEQMVLTIRWRDKIYERGAKLIPNITKQRGEVPGELRTNDRNVIWVVGNCSAHSEVRLNALE